MLWGFWSGGVNKTHEIYRQWAEDVIPVMPTNFTSTRFFLKSEQADASLPERKRAFFEANVVLSVLSRHKGATNSDLAS